jgi:hypothetical protein
VDETPLWAILLIGLGSGALGAFATAWYGARHERTETDRERKLEACYDFVRVTQDSMGTTRDALHWLRANSVVQMDEQLLARTVTAGEALLGAYQRIALLFGPTSKIGKVAETIVDTVTNILTAFRATLPDGDAAYEAMVAMGNLLDDEFVVLAHRGIQGSGGTLSGLRR